MISKKKVLLVCSPYYKDITSNLIKGASDLLESNSIDYNILNVPGALEVAPAIKFIFDKSLKKPIFDGFVALGCVIKGETPHFDFISSATTNAIMQLSVNSKKPVGNGVITCLNMKQAIIRKKKGSEAAQAVLSILSQK